MTDAFALVSTSSKSTLAFGTVAPVLSETVPVTVDVDAVCAESETAIDTTTKTSRTTNPKSILTRRIKTSSNLSTLEIGENRRGNNPKLTRHPLRLARRLAQYCATRNLYIVPLNESPLFRALGVQGRYIQSVKYKYIKHLSLLINRLGSIKVHVLLRSTTEVLTHA